MHLSPNQSFSTPIPSNLAKEALCQGNLKVSDPPPENIYQSSLALGVRHFRIHYQYTSASVQHRPGQLRPSHLIAHRSKALETRRRALDIAAIKGCDHHVRRQSSQRGQLRPWTDFFFDGGRKSPAFNRRTRGVDGAHGTGGSDDGENSNSKERGWGDSSFFSPMPQ